MWRGAIDQLVSKLSELDTCRSFIALSPVASTCLGGSECRRPDAQGQGWPALEKKEKESLLAAERVPMESSEFKGRCLG